MVASPLIGMCGPEVRYPRPPMGNVTMLVGEHFASSAETLTPTASRSTPWVLDSPSAARSGPDPEELIVPPLTDALNLSYRIDEAVREACTPEVLTVPALAYEELTVPRIGRARLVEDLWLTRRTFSTLAFLMMQTANATTEASDFTEAAGTLLRRMLELMAQVVWLTGVEPPTDLALPVAVASHDPLVTIAEEYGWLDSLTYAIGLAGAAEWIDLQAARSELHEVRRQHTIGQALVSIGGQDMLYILDCPRSDGAGQTQRSVGTGHPSL